MFVPQLSTSRLPPEDAQVLPPLPVGSVFVALPPGPLVCGPLHPCSVEALQLIRTGGSGEILEIPRDPASSFPLPCTCLRWASSSQLPRTALPRSCCPLILLLPWSCAHASEYSVPLLKSELLQAPVGEAGSPQVSRASVGDGLTFRGRGYLLEGQVLPLQGGDEISPRWSPLRRGTLCARRLS